MFKTHPWLTLTRLTQGICAGSVLMFLEGCDPEVRDVWISGIEAAALGVVTALTGLMSTAVTALLTGFTSTGDDTTTTVQAIFEWAPQALC